MGTADPHTAWGVAVAYVSQRQFDVAKERGAATVTPVVSWELIEPGESEPGSTLDHPGATSIGIAATWPRGTLPGAIRLFHAGEEIPLGGSLWNLLRDVPLQASELPIRSGDFYLPWSARPTQPADWIGNGWPVGAYAFEVEIGPGVRKMLPFTLGGARSP
jgi:hypothetical protein